MAEATRSNKSSDLIPKVQSREDPTPPSGTPISPEPTSWRWDGIAVELGLGDLAILWRDLRLLHVRLAREFILAQWFVG